MKLLSQIETSVSQALFPVPNGNTDRGDSQYDLEIELNIQHSEHGGIKWHSSERVRRLKILVFAK